MTEGGKIPVNFTVSDLVKDMGEKLTIDLPTKTNGELKLSIVYETSPKASGLQWLTPENTLGKKHPYMYSQCQVMCNVSISSQQTVTYPWIRREESELAYFWDDSLLFH